MVRLYQILGDAKVLDGYRETDQRLAETRSALANLLDDEGTRDDLEEFASVHNEIARAMGATSPGSSAFASTLGRIDRLNELAASIAQSSNRQVDMRLTEMKQQTESTQKRLFWQSALLAPLTLIAILALTLSIGRPLRAIDRAISELGRGTFSRSIEVQGPRDLERLGAQLEWLRLRLLDLAQERNRFLRHMSHELKTPLANIREGAELLMDGAVGPLDNSQREVVAILRDNGIKLHRLIENLLSFSAWQKESVGLDLSEFRLRPLVKQVLESQQLTVVSQRVRLEVKVDDLMLRADRGKVRLIIENLLSNAIKYSPKGGTVYLHAAKQDTQLVIDVADMGSGIPAEERARVFEAFYTGRPPAGVQVKGTGIGLSVVLEFVNAHGGTIEIVDGEYPGAHFRIRMPVLLVTKPQGQGQGQAHAA
jgi:two-component system sensor histidine kinase GlrK